MCIVAGGGDQFSITASNRVIPALQILGGPSEEVGEHQFRIAAIGPQPVKEHYGRIDPSRVSEEIVDFDSVDGSCLPALRLSWIRRERKTAAGSLLIDNFLRRFRGGRRAL